MRLSTFLLTLLTLGACNTRPTLPETTREMGRPPNVIVILADDLGYGDTSPYGGWVATPSLDRMAAEGLMFTDFHASGPVCSPTRAGLVTGRYQQRAGLPGVIYANPAANRHHGLNVEETTFAERLRQAGYATAIFGKWHLGYDPPFNPIHHGFDQFRGYVSGNVDYFSHVDGVGFYDWWDGDTPIEEPGYVTHLITKHAVQFIEAQRNQPFCLYVAHEAPHFPFQGPQDEAFRVVGQRVPEAREPTQVKRAYREMVEELDHSVGAILDAVTRLGLAENTFVLFFSDNGALDYGSNGSLRGYKGSLWEGGHRVPALAWWPGRIAPGRTTDATAISLDVMPTLLDAAGVGVREDLALDGVSLLPLLLYDEMPAPRTLFWAYQQQAAVRQGPWKLVADTPDQPGLQLFNLADDLSETTDLAGTYPQQVEALQTALAAWQTNVASGATLQPELN